MHLVMAVGETILEAIELDREQAGDKAFLLSLKYMLNERHWLTVAAYQQRPSFYLQAYSSLQNPKPWHCVVAGAAPKISFVKTFCL